MNFDRILERVVETVFIIVFTVVVLYMVLPFLGFGTQETKTVVATAIPQVVVASVTR